VCFFFALPVRRFCIVACYASFAAAGRQSYRLTTDYDHRFTVLQEFIARNGEADCRRRRYGWAGDIFFVSICEINSPASNMGTTKWKT